MRAVVQYRNYSAVPFRLKYLIDAGEANAGYREYQGGKGSPGLPPGPRGDFSRGAFRCSRESSEQEEAESHAMGGNTAFSFFSSSGIRMEIRENGES